MFMLLLVSWHSTENSDVEKCGQIVDNLCFCGKINAKKVKKKYRQSKSTGID